MLRRLLPQGLASEMADASGRIVVAEMAVDESWVGVALTRVEELTGARVAYVTRLGEGMLPGPQTVHQEGDLLHLVIERPRLETVERILDNPPPRES